MHETDAPYSRGTGAQPGGTDPGGVKERVSDTAAQLGDAGRDTAHDAKEKAHDVAHEASERARGMIGRTRIELKAQAETQQQRLAGGLRSLGDEMGQMADGAQEPGYATELVRHAGDATGQAARWFEDREPEAILREVEDFARRRPGLFIAMAAGAGLLVGRFLRSMKDSPDDDEARDPRQASPSAAPASAPSSAGRQSAQPPTSPTPPPAGPTPPPAGQTPSPTPAPTPTPTPAPSPSAGAAPVFPPPTPGASGQQFSGGDPYGERA